MKYLVEGTISADGRFVAWTIWVDGFVETVVVADRAKGVTTDPGFDVATDPSISADGRLLAVEAGFPPAILRYDQVTGSSHAVSVTFDGSPANGTSADPAISPDGRAIAFSSQATNLVPEPLAAGIVPAGAVYLSVPALPR